MAYSTEYFLTESNGWREYLTSRGLVLPPRLQAIWNYLDVQPGLWILDVGCGRGEILVHCGLQNVQAVGIDYSPVALKLARDSISEIKKLETGLKNPSLIMGNAQWLPFPDNTFDRIVMSDIVEHLNQEELESALKEVYRVLVPGGMLLVHTMPNLWYYRYGYPLFRSVQELRGVQLPSNPRERYRFPEVHINEQTPLTLYATLSRIGFSRWRVWLHDYRDYNTYSPIMRVTMRLLTRLPGLRLIFCDDIFAKAYK
ncbi:MAG: methyltransferase domain-containing protein [Candidatus Methanomethylicaceae archaeon]